MKNKLISLFAAATVGICALLGGCSCSGDNTLSFNNNAANSETLTYKVEYSEDYIENNKKTADLDKYFTFEYSNGTYVTELKQANASEITSDILDIKDAKGESLVSTIYKLTSDFSIDIKLNIGDKSYDHTEKITTQTYIAQAGVSFAPLYSKAEAEYTVISVNETADSTILKSVTETFYNKSEYRTVKKYKYFDMDAAAESIKLDDVTEKEHTEKYSFRSVIDNAELLFALRGITLEEKSTTNISVVSPEYDKSVSLSIANTAKSEEEFTITYNGEEVKETLKYNSYSYLVNSNNVSGSAQYVNIQSESAGKIANNALILKYSKPLIAYGSFSKMGALVFTLTDVVIG